VVAVCLIPGISSGHSLELAGGVHSNFDSEHRDRFGTDTAWSLGYATPLSPKHGRSDVQLMLEVSYVSASDDGLRDPTFTGTEESYRFVPLLMGVRTNFVQNKDHPGIRLYGGLAVTTVLGRFENLNGETDNATTFGGAVELRPEFTLTGPLSLWFRQRVYVFGDTRYRGFGEINYSGASMQAGLCWRLNGESR
jgi:hypothetical protein